MTVIDAFAVPRREPASRWRRAPLDKTLPVYLKLKALPGGLR